MKNGAGFTLIELLVVISIVTLLSSIVLAAVTGARAKARDARRVADIEQFEIALQLFYDEYGVYPCGDAGLDRDQDHSSSGGFIDGVNSWDKDGSGTYKCGSNRVDGPDFGLYDAGYYPKRSPEDPVNTPEHKYAYKLGPDRDMYAIAVKLESSGLGATDGGLLPHCYEAVPGRGNY